MKADSASSSDCASFESITNEPLLANVWEYVVRMAYAANGWLLSFELYEFVFHCSSIAALTSHE